MRSNLMPAENERPELTDEYPHPDAEFMTSSTYCPEHFAPLNMAAVMARVDELLRERDEMVAQAVAFADRAERLAAELERRRATPAPPYP
jgi:hypothetical protein